MPLPETPSSAATHSRTQRSIDELDTAICRLARQPQCRELSIACARARVRRTFRLGEVELSELRRVARVALWTVDLRRAREGAHGARVAGLPAISAAFADGRLSYTKVRALTRAAQTHDEDLLLAYALQATAAQVEERCRQIRNSAPDSADARTARVGAPLALGLAQPEKRHGDDQRSSCRSRRPN